MVYHLDYETRSLADLKKVGAFRYAADSSTRILCAAISRGSEEPALFVPPQFWINGEPPLGFEQQKRAEDLLREINESSLIYAHNAPFEIAITLSRWKKDIGFRAPHYSQFRCTMDLARRAALPISLKQLGDALGLQQLKSETGKSGISKFSLPRKDTTNFNHPNDFPEDFREFCRYCLQDVRVEQEIEKRLKYFKPRGMALETYLFDLDMAVRGFPVNVDAVKKALKLVEQASAEQVKEFTKITGLTPTQNAKVLQWMKKRGYPFDNMQAETIEDAMQLEDFDPNSEYGRALTIKQRVSYSSLAKLAKMELCADPKDNRVRGSIVVHGAGTGRWSASLVQPQNMKRPTIENFEDAYRDICEGCTVAWLEMMYGPALEVISSCVRNFIHDIAEDGTHTPFLNADYSAIEARIIAQQARERWRLKVFRSHGQIYEASASQMFKVPFEEFASYKALNGGKNHPLRQKGKIGELALGYQGHVGAMLKMGALRMGLTRDELPEIVKAWRAASPNICKLWDDAEKAAINAIKNPDTEFPYGMGCHFIRTKAAGIDYLFSVLPSGRKIAYPKPELSKQIRYKTIDPKTGEPVMHTSLNPTEATVLRVRKKDPKARITDCVTFYGQLKGTVHWGRCSTYGGSLVENMVQGYAADIMAHGALNAEAHGYEIFLLIHDEALARLKPGQSVEEFVRLLSKLPEWAEGLPLAAEGDIIDFYTKK